LEGKISWGLGYYTWANSTGHTSHHWTELWLALPSSLHSWGNGTNHSYT
jgi:hypothetical protein